MPGLAAKPILDINVVIRDTGDLPVVTMALSSMGYLHQGDLGIPGREAFLITENSIARSWPMHHLYVCAEGAQELL